MRRIRLGLTAATATVMLTAGCAASSPAARAPVATATTPAATAPAATAPAGSPSSAATPAAASALPDGYDATRDAKADIKTALAKAARDHREVLIDFGADWCPDCKALDVMFRSAQVEPRLQKGYLTVAVDVGKFNHNLDLAAQYVNLQTSGIPALVVLRSDGTVRTSTDDGSFSNARTMSPSQVSAFLTHWAPGATR